MNVTKRLAIIAGLIVASMLPSTIAIVMVSQSAEAFLAEMNGHRTIIATASQLERAVIDAETAQRAFLLSGASAYRDEFTAARARAVTDQQRLRQMARDGAPVNIQRIEAVLRPASAEIELLDRLAKDGRGAALAVVSTQEGRFEATEMRQAVEDLNIAQSDSFLHGGSQVHRAVLVGRWLAIGGAVVGIVAALVSLGVLGLYLMRSLRIVLNAMQEPDASGIPADIAARLNGEFRSLSEVYNGMCERIRREIAKRDEAENRIAALLDRSGAALANRQRAGDILARIAHRLPACVDQQELVALAARFIPQLFDIKGGALYFLNNSSTVLSRVAVWGDGSASLPEFPPNKCWALRRGQPHHVDDVEADVTCAHLGGDRLASYACLPLIAQGETVGLLYLEGGLQTADSMQIQDALGDMRVLCENLALALVNLRLRESLRHQSLRDPLTGLHNRRYLEETIDLEFAKSRRSKTPVSVILIDVDHFKHINDTFGHDAGDIVLRHLAATIGTHIRKGDVACRYGGEEFVIMLPGLSHAAAMERAELLRTHIRGMKLHSGDTEIPQITASFGVATFDGGEDAPADLIRYADHALYQAKAAGRDRIFPHLANPTRLAPLSGV